MKLLHVIASIDPLQGGVYQSIRNTIPELEKLGVYNEVITLDDPQASYLCNNPFSVKALGPGRTLWQYNAKLMPWLVKKLSCFDVVIVHGLWLYPSYAVNKAIRLLKKWQHRKASGKVPRVFIMPHGMLDPYFQRAKERKIKAIRNYFYWKLIEGSVVNEADGVLFTCDAELKLARLPFRPYKPKAEKNIGLGIEEPPVYIKAMRNAFADKCPQLQGEPYILFLSRIHEKKGVDLLIKAYEKLLTARAKSILAEPTYTVAADLQLCENIMPKLVIAGPGLETDYGKYIQQLAAASPQLQSSIYFIDMITGNAKWGAFYGCEAFILPSHQENFGIAVAEAMACGKPVLISDQVNISSEIKRAGAGLVAEDTEAGTFKLLTDWQNMLPDQQQTMGDRARETFENYFAIGPNAIRLLEAIS